MVNGFLANRLRTDRLGAALFCWMAIAVAPNAAAQNGVCASPGEFCGRSIESRCLQRLGAGAVGAETLAEGQACTAQLAQYRDCLSLVAAQCPGAVGAPRASNAPAASALEIWSEIKNEGDPEVFDAFAASYPASPLAVLATKRAKALRAGAAPRAQAGASATPPSDEELAAQAEEARLRAQFKEAQSHLNRVGYAAGPEDGVWGARSGAALQSFLKNRGRDATRMLTPEALALLRVAPTGSAPKPKSAPKPQSAPSATAEESQALKTESAEPAKTLTARLEVEFRFNDRTRRRCVSTLPVENKALNIQSFRLECGVTSFVRLRTDVEGRALAAAVIHDGDSVTLNGSRWRYSGRRSGARSPTDLRSAVLNVSFSDR